MCRVDCLFHQTTFQAYRCAFACCSQDASPAKPVEVELDDLEPEELQEMKEVADLLAADEVQNCFFLFLPALNGDGAQWHRAMCFF